MRDKILEYYKTLLALGWMYPDEKGFIYTKVGDVDVPAVFDGKHLILPTRAQLKNTDWTERLIFNPMHEEFNLGVSDVLSEFRGQVNNRLNATLAKVFEHFINLGINQETHKHLNSEQGQVLNRLAKVSDKTAQRLSEIRRKMANNNTSKFINLFIKRGGVVNGEGFARVGIVNFPFYNELCDPEKLPAGVKLSKEDRKIFKELYEFIFPFLLTDSDGYSVGVNSRTAPNLECFVRSTIKAVSTLMEAMRPYQDLFPDFDPFLTFPEDLPAWLDLFDNKALVEKAARAIPKLPGSEGRDEDESEERETVREESDERGEPDRAEAEPRNEPAPKPARKGPMKIGNPTGAPNSQVKETPAEREAISRAFVPRPRDVDHAELARERRARELEEEEDRRRRRRGRDDDEDDRDYDRRRYRGRSRRDERDDRDYDRDSRRRSSRRDRDDDDRDHDRGPRSIWDNPILRDAEDDARYDSDHRRRSRGRYEDDYDRGRRDPWGRSLGRRR